MKKHEREESNSRRRKMVAEGKTVQEIAKREGVTDCAITSWLRKYGFKAKDARSGLLQDKLTDEQLTAAIKRGQSLATISENYHYDDNREALIARIEKLGLTGKVAKRNRFWDMPAAPTPIIRTYEEDGHTVNVYQSAPAHGATSFMAGW